MTDFYQGQLSPAFERVSESDISFVMYYAPWDAESQAVRSHFKAVAQYYHQQVCSIFFLNIGLYLKYIGTYLVLKNS